MIVVRLRLPNCHAASGFMKLKTKEEKKLRAIHGVDLCLKWANCLLARCGLSTPNEAEILLILMASFIFIIY